ncbi:DNA-directed RNA polymerase [Histoplasma capsulatum var. duboisii H88]|uniref:DNA-directed RNA polymerase n=1 Tax=Ajellomyces capsulatus (strain H88) TaxID=544711 RepID=F0UNN0_AJEC8|nr:DNA-directed RNA polymerase [Histoplasma capsulatum var. duboisii H88]QSS53801.1 mitochondrial RNA polymerase [Histoplasma capsulatum var. duboisii H88]
MLCRAAQRRQTLLQLGRSYEHLSSPWTSSVYPRLKCQSSRIQTLCRPVILPTLEAPNSLSLQSTRSLATATSDINIPFEGLPYGHAEIHSPLNVSPLSNSPWNERLPYPEPDDIDTSSVIIRKDFLISRPLSVRRSNGIGGELSEMLANLDVSLSAAMFRRSEILIHRVAKLIGYGTPEVLDLHNKYLRSMISHMIVHRRYGMVWWAQKWFEVDMKYAFAEPDAITYALMIKMALRMLFENKQKRTVRRYWNLAKDAEIEEAVLGLPILSEADLGLLSEICSENAYNDSTMLDESSIEPDEDFSKVKPKLHPPDDIAIVRPTDQRGLGLSSLRETLSIFDSEQAVPRPPDLTGSQEEQDLAYAQMRQRRLESDCVESAIARWKKESEMLHRVGVNPIPSKPMGAFLYDWHTQLMSRINEELERIEESEKKSRMSPADSQRVEISPYLRAIKTDKLAALTILSTFNALNKSGVDKGLKLTGLVMYVGKAVYDEYLAMQLRELEKKSKPTKKISALIDKLVHKGTRKAQVQWRRIIARFEQSQRPVDWSPVVQAKIGACLASMLLSTATVPVPTKDPKTNQQKQTDQAAFRRVYQLERGFRVGYVHANDYIVEKLRREPLGELLAKHLPMVCPPRPWTSARGGGFLEYPSTVMRVKQGDISQLSYVETAAARGDLDTVFAGLTVLGKTGWKINRGVLNVMLEAWNSGEEIANLAPENPNIIEPEKPDTDDRDILKDYYRARMHATNARTGYHSQRCFQNFQLEIARAYRNETFYLPHNLDFRGRAYPMPPYFNQMGADHCRGLLLFSKGRELGASGLRWLKIHLANVFGFDKASFQEREQFAMDHLEDIRDSAINGLKGKRWWLDAGDPFQCLAACIELTNAMALEDPTKYVSHLPVHQDGSCNGLQHYAALGGDVIGAQQVNLEPSDRPSDIYTGVAEHVKQSIQKDAAKGNETAKLLEDKITRKIVKQTVMTNVYGVTFLGAIRQVRKQLVDHYPDLLHSGVAGECATYIARKIFVALGSMFTGAHDIQFWLGDCANRISQSLSSEQIEALSDERNLKVVGRFQGAKKLAKNIKDPKSHFKSTVVWTTPLKLPVAQPYRDAACVKVFSDLQQLSIRNPQASDVVNKRKQLQAFPPNFVHSLDATHMFLSAVKCDELGLSFSAVHDSFWTHAADVDTMNRVLRDAFVRMHSEDIIQRLASEFKTRYANHMYLAHVQPNTQLAKAISKWRKTTKSANSKQAQLDELVNEYRRLKLLRSNDPKLQTQGREMVTAGKFVAELQDAESSLASMQSLGVAGIGQIPPDESVKPKGDRVVTSEDPLDELEESLVGDALRVDPSNQPDELSMDQGLDVAASPSTKPKAKSKPAPIWVWLPLTFRAVPAKGQFDVTKLKNSEYFFS